MKLNKAFLDLVEEWDSRPFRMIVVGDTHIPDRIRVLHPELISSIRNQQPDGIIHTGDICQLEVLDMLSQIAPVLAVRGNRDLLLANLLPTEVSFSLNGVKITCLHGHGRPLYYLVDKAYFMFTGRQQRFTLPWLEHNFNSSQMIIYGHTHIKRNQKIGDQVFFNPGSPTKSAFDSGVLSYGVVTVYPDKRIDAGFQNLSGWKKIGRDWEKKKP
jgi:putative phosphoesterase